MRGCSFSALSGVVDFSSFVLGGVEDESGVGVGSWEGEGGESTGGDSVTVDSQESSVVSIQSPGVEGGGSDHDLGVVVLDVGDNSVVGWVKLEWAFHFIN